MDARALALVFVIVLGGTARAEDPPTPLVPALPVTPPPPEVEPPETPYTEGWRGGSPPGEHVTFRLMLWSVDHGTALEFSNNQRTGVVTSRELAQPSHQLVAGAGIEIAGGKTGWYSFDYWQLTSRGVTQLAAPVTITDTTFPAGDTVVSDTGQHYAKFRDALDIRYRLPLGPDECWLDFNFGPVLGIGARYEGIEIESLTAPRRNGSHSFAVTVLGGLRAGLDLHISNLLTARIGSDLDGVPWTGKRRFSLTRAPSISKWKDLRIFLAFRFVFVELEVGYRYFLSEASGSRIRQADVNMQGGDVTLAFRF